MREKKTQQAQRESFPQVTFCNPGGNSTRELCKTVWKQKGKKKPKVACRYNSPPYGGGQFALILLGDAKGGKKFGTNGPKRSIPRFFARLPNVKGGGFSATNHIVFTLEPGPKNQLKGTPRPLLGGPEGCRPTLTIRVPELVNNQAPAKKNFPKTVKVGVKKERGA